MTRFTNPILVTRPYLPSLDAFKAGLEEIWANRWLTNNGPILKRFHGRLSEWLGVPDSNMALFNNGTLALEIGFQALGLAGGDVITTPFTFVATAHALKRIGATPIFADVDPRTLCLSPTAAEQLITPRTKAIVPVHVYGHPCDVEGFAALGRKYGVKIVYDAAHAFGVELGLGEWDCGRRTARSASIARYGDMSMFSFHPTKLFHSCEGGLLVFKDPALQESVNRLRNFAIKDECVCVDVGTNAKMNELQALMGLSCLEAMDEILASRARIHSLYAEAFSSCRDVTFPDPSTFVHGKAARLFRPNYAYCPIFFESRSVRECVYEALKKANVFTRRYFYPLLTDFAPYVYAHDSCPVAADFASRVLTLPTYFGLSDGEVMAIAENVLEIVGRCRQCCQTCQ